MKCFDLLGLPFEATPEQVKTRFRELARLTHPDRGGDADKFIEYQKAYELALHEANKPLKCQECNGAGKVPKMKGFRATLMKCAECNGLGTKERGS